MPKIASEIQHINAEDIKSVFASHITSLVRIYTDRFDGDSYKRERASLKRAQFSIDYVRNLYIARLEKFGLKYYMSQNIFFTPDQEELDTFNDPTEAIKQAIINKADSLFVEDVYDCRNHTEECNLGFRKVCMEYVINILHTTGCDAIDAFYASQPVCDCYEN